MLLRDGEVIARIVKRHKTPYFLKLIFVLLFSLPIYFLLFYIAGATEGEWIYAVFAAVSFFIGSVVAVISIDYLFDKIVITNHRIVWVDWVNIFKKAEMSVEILDIQDISTRAKGILAKIDFFDYGFIEIKTASPDMCIIFNDCPSPDELKFYVVSHIHKTRGGTHEKKV